MSKKKIIIILAVIFLVFITAFIFAFCHREQGSPEIVPDKYAANNYSGFNPSTTPEPTPYETDANGQTILPSYTYTTVGETFTYSGVEYLTTEQQPTLVVETMMEGITVYANDEYVGKNITEVTILPTSAESLTYVTVSFDDGSYADLVCPFDPYTTHNYRYNNVCTVEYWEYVSSGANAG